MDIELLARLAQSKKLADRQQAQRMLQGAGEYSGKIDGVIGDGSRKAIKRLRDQVAAQKRALAEQAAAGKKADAAARLADAQAKKAEADAIKAKADAERQQRADEQAAKDKAFNKSLVETGSLTVAVVAGAAYGEQLSKKITLHDDVVAKAKNKELKKVEKQIAAVQDGKGARIKSGDYRKTAKMEARALAKSARDQGLTKLRRPHGFAKAGVFLAEAVMARVLAETAAKDNEYARQGLHTLSTGLTIAGLTTPASRAWKIASAPAQLDGGALAKVNQAIMIGDASMTPKQIAAEADRATDKSVKATAKAAAKKGGNIALKALGPLGWAVAAGFAAKMAYDEFKRSGSLFKAAEAGANEATSGLYKKAKVERRASLRQSRAINARRANIRAARAASRKKVRQAVAKPTGRVKGYWRTSKNGTRHWVRGHRSI